METIVLKFGFEKRVILAKFHFYIKCSMEISGKGLLHFYEETPSLIRNQTNHRMNLFTPSESNSCYESDYECSCILINGKTRSVPLNILSSVLWPVYTPYRRELIFEFKRG